MKHLFNECLPLTVQFYTSGQSKISNLFNTFFYKRSRSVSFIRQLVVFNVQLVRGIFAFEDLAKFYSLNLGLIIKINSTFY